MLMELQMIAEEILTTREAAQLLRISPITIRKLIRVDSLPAHRMGRKWVFLKSEVLEWVKKR